MKAETYLRYRQIEFEAVACDPRQSPSKQIPFITIDELGDSRTIIDSEKIIGYFELRQGDPQGWDVFLPDLKKHMEGLKGKVLPLIIRRLLLRQMARRGMKPENTEASYAPGIRLLDVLSDMLGKKDYFLGKNIRTLDISIYAFLANIVDQPYPNLIQNHARSLGNLVNYCERVKQLIWGNWHA